MSVLRQADNRVVIEGILVEKEMEIKTLSGNRQAITGKLDIKTDDNSVHTVEVFSFMLKKDGSENGIAKGLVTIMNDYKTVQEVGEELADKVRVTSGELRKNEYFGQDGTLKSYVQFSTNFVNRLKATDDYEPKATFEVELYVQAIVPEVRDDEETGRLVIKGLVPLYGGKVIPQQFVVADKKAVQYIEQNYEVGSTVKLKGYIINSVQTTTVVEEMGFGEDIERTITKTVRELLVTGGTPPYDEESKVFSTEVIKEALVERETFLDELKAKTEQKGSTSGGSTNTTGGFDVGTSDTSTGTGTGAKKYDMPF